VLQALLQEVSFVKFFELLGQPLRPSPLASLAQPPKRVSVGILPGLPTLICFYFSMELLPRAIAAKLASSPEPGRDATVRLLDEGARCRSLPSLPFKEVDRQLR